MIEKSDTYLSTTLTLGYILVNLKIKESSWAHQTKKANNL